MKKFKKDDIVYINKRNQLILLGKIDKIISDDGIYSYYITYIKIIKKDSEYQHVEIDGYNKICSDTFLNKIDLKSGLKYLI